MMRDTDQAPLLVDSSSEEFWPRTARRSRPCATAGAVPSVTAAAVPSEPSLYATLTLIEPEPSRSHSRMTFSAPGDPGSKNAVRYLPVMAEPLSVVYASVIL